jgi:hypothetical protein
MKKIIVIVTFILCLSLNTNVYAASNSSGNAAYSNIVVNYYDVAYDIYLSMQMQDLSGVLDMSSVQNQNFVDALEANTITWKHSIQQGYTKDVRERYPLYFEFKKIDKVGDTVFLTVNISGDSTEAYPPFVAFGENKFILKQSKGNWLITQHDYNDVVLFEQSKTEKKDFQLDKVRIKVDEQNAQTMTLMIPNEDVGILSNPYTDYTYSTSRAVQYANNFVVSRNTYFYDAGLDCTNFISQCVSYGFGSTTSYSSSSSYRMVPGTWSAGSGGGYPAWEIVSSHWSYMISSKTGLNGPRVGTRTWSTLSNGGVMQIDFTSNGTYDHTVICVDKANQKFAQHTDNGYRYYNDYTGSKRFYQPSYFRSS